MVLALQVAFNEIRQQVFEDVGGVLQPPLKCRHDEWGHVATVAHGEGALQLQCPDEREQENLIVHQLSELLQGFLHAGLAASRHLGARQETVTQTDIKEIEAKQQRFLWKPRKNWINRLWAQQEHLSMVSQHAGVQTFWWETFTDCLFFFFIFSTKRGPWLFCWPRNMSAASIWKSDFSSWDKRGSKET